MIYEAQAGTIKGIRSVLCCPACTYLHFIPDSWVLKGTSRPTGEELLLFFWFLAEENRQETGEETGISPCSWWDVVSVPVMALGPFLSRGKGLGMPQALEVVQREGAAGKGALPEPQSPRF